MLRSGLVNQAQLVDVVEKAIRKLGKKAVKVNYNIGEDSDGDPSIFFRIVLPDAASAEDTLAEVTGRITRILNDQIRPREDWGLLPYFSFRSKSEQAERDDPEWA